MLAQDFGAGAGTRPEFMAGVSPDPAPVESIAEGKQAIPGVSGRPLRCQAVEEGFDLACSPGMPPVGFEGDLTGHLAHGVVLPRAFGLALAEHLPGEAGVPHGAARAGVFCWPGNGIDGF
jgi:hypothetical protein